MNDIKRTKEKIKNGERGHMGQLPNFLGVRTGQAGQLNPLFVAEMMGFQSDWTVLPFQNGGKNQ
jgi:hypothetical protein